jgi:hypothetical protein
LGCSRPKDNIFGLAAEPSAISSGKPLRPMRAIRGLGANMAINIGIWALAETFRSN